MSVKQLSLFSLDGNSKECSNQFDLPFHIAFCHPLYLSLPDHVHDLVALQGSPRRLEREKAHPRLRQAFNEPVILLDQIVEIFHLSQFTVCGKVPFRLKPIEGFGVGCVFVNSDDARCHGMSCGKGCEKELSSCLCISCWVED